MTYGVGYQRASYRWWSRCGLWFIPAHNAITPVNIYGTSPVQGSFLSILVRRVG